MRTKDVAERLDVSTASVRQWTADVYPEFFSASARGGKTREFTDRDVQILAAIAEMSKSNVGRDDIRIELTQIQANNWQALPPVPGLPIDDGEPQYIHREVAEKAVANVREVLDLQIAQLRREIDTLRESLEHERSRRVDLENELRDKERHLGELTGRLGSVDAERGRERRLLTYAVIAVAVTAAVLLAVVLLLALTPGG